MTWLYENRELTEEEVSNHIGFVYMITNLTNGRRYIGKKLFTKAKTRIIKQRKRRLRVANNWEKYFGSNKELIADVTFFGQDNFKREILYLCKTKGICNYYEAMLQFQHGVLLDRSWYNDQIYLRVHRSHISKIINNE
jgi:hypothetical protein